MLGKNQASLKIIDANQIKFGGQGIRGRRDPAKSLQSGPLGAQTRSVGSFFSQSGIDSKGAKNTPETFLSMYWRQSRSASSAVETGGEASPHKTKKSLACPNRVISLQIGSRISVLPNPGTSRLSTRLVERPGQR